jgi:hypothetical protein
VDIQVAVDATIKFFYEDVTAAHYTSNAPLIAQFSSRVFEKDNI